MYSQQQCGTALDHMAALRRDTNDAFWGLFFDDKRYLVLCGGGGSGKSIFAGRKVLERVTTERGHRWLVCRKVARTLRDSCFAQLVGQAQAHYADCGLTVLSGDLRIKFQNGSEILFAGLDDVEKLKSIYDITGIWVEEASELAEGDFNQLDIRLRTDFPYYLQMILSFNPISATHWLKKRFFDVADPRATTHRSTYRDNRFLPPEAVRTLEAFRDTDPYYYQVYCLGEWGVTGKTVFDGRAVTERLSALRAPEKLGLWEYAEDGLRVSDGVWRDDSAGCVTIYREPVPGRPYVIGGDTSGEGSDWFVGQVLDNITGEQVAVLRHQADEDTYAKQMYWLGKYYNDALIGIEANFSSYPIKRLEMLGYRNQFVRQVEDTYTGRVSSAYGFRTTATTRPVIIAQLVESMRDGIALINDRVTLEEMLTFVRNEKLRPEAEAGAHDDTIMALAIAWYIRPQQRMTVQPTQEERRAARWTKDMLEDYYSADAAERAYLRQKWGEPS